MSDAISLAEALAILNRFPVSGAAANEGFRYVAADHDELWIEGADPDSLPYEEAARLEELHFTWDENTESWHTFT